MSIDLVERLRDCRVMFDDTIVLVDAIAEIDRLRHEEMRLRTALDYHVNELRGARREIERLLEREAELQAQCGYTDSIKTLEIERLEALILDGCQVFEHYDLPEHAYHYRRELDRSTDRPRDDGTVVAVGGEPGASAGKSE